MDKPQVRTRLTTFPNEHAPSKWDKAGFRGPWPKPEPDKEWDPKLVWDAWKGSLDAKIDAFIHFPDERTTMFLLRENPINLYDEFQKYTQGQSTHRRQSLAKQWNELTRHTLERTQNRGEILNPPLARILHIVCGRGREEGPVDIATLSDETAGTGMGEASRKVIDWSRKETNPVQITNALVLGEKFSGVVRNTVLANTRLVATRKGIRTVARHLDDRGVLYALRNPALTTDSADELADTVISKLLTQTIHARAGNNFFQEWNRAGRRLNKAVVETVLKTVKETRNGTMRYVASAIPEVLENDQAREEILSGGDFNTWEAALAVTTGRTWAKIALTMVSSLKIVPAGWAKTAKILDATTDETLKTLTRADLVPLLSHKDDGVRVAVTRLITRTEAKTRNSAGINR